MSEAVVVPLSLAVAADALVSFSLTVPAVASSVAVTRAAVNGVHSWVPRPRLQRLELMTSEAVTNSIRHGRRQPGDEVTFDLVVTPDLAIGTVTDRNDAFTVELRCGHADDPGGFGLFVIDDLSAWWRVERVDGCNRLVFAV